MTQFLIQASPLTRIRLPEWHLKCLNNPELLTSKEPFTITIPRTLGAISLTHGKVTAAGTLMPRIKNRLADEDEITPLVRWLTSPFETETDIWGVVGMKVSDDMADMVIQAVLGANSPTSKSVTDTVTELQNTLSKAFVESRKEADERVTRALGKLYNVVKRTMDDMRRNNMGEYSPSYAEAIACMAVTDTVKRREVHDVRARDLLKQAFDVRSASPNG